MSTLLSSQGPYFSGSQSYLPNKYFVNPPAYLPLRRNLVEEELTTPGVSQTLLASLKENDPELWALIKGDSQLMGLLDGSKTKVQRGQIASDFIRKYPNLNPRLKNGIINLATNLKFGTLLSTPANLDESVTVDLEKINRILGKDIYNRIVNLNLVSETGEELVRNALKPSDVLTLQESGVSENTVVTLLSKLLPVEDYKDVQNAVNLIWNAPSELPEEPIVEMNEPVAAIPGVVNQDQAIQTDAQEAVNQASSGIDQVEDPLVNSLQDEMERNRSLPDNSTKKLATLPAPLRRNPLVPPSPRTVQPIAPLAIQQTIDAQPGLDFGDKPEEDSSDLPVSTVSTSENESDLLDTMQDNVDQALETIEGWEAAPDEVVPDAIELIEPVADLIKEILVRDRDKLSDKTKQKLREMQDTIEDKIDEIQEYLDILDGKETERSDEPRAAEFTAAQERVEQLEQENLKLKQEREQMRKEREQINRKQFREMMDSNKKGQVVLQTQFPQFTIKVPKPFGVNISGYGLFGSTVSKDGSKRHYYSSEVPASGRGVNSSVDTSDLSDTMGEDLNAQTKSAITKWVNSLPVGDLTIDNTSTDLNPWKKEQDASTQMIIKVKHEGTQTLKQEPSGIEISKPAQVVGKTENQSKTSKPRGIVTTKTKLLKESKEKQDPIKFFDELLKKVNPPKIKAFMIEGIYDNAKLFIKHLHIQGFKPTTKVNPIAERAAYIYKRINDNLNPEKIGKMKPTLQKFAKELVEMKPELKKIAESILGLPDDDYNSEDLVNRIPLSGSVKGQRLRGRGFVFKTHDELEAQGGALKAIHDQMKSDPGRQLMTSYFRVKTYPSGISNQFPYRMLTYSKMNKRDKEKFKDVTRDDYNHDAQVIRNYIRENRAKE